MSDRRQKIQLSLAFSTSPEGETGGSAGKGTESLPARQTPQSPASTESLMEEVCETDNMRKAYQRVRANKGGPGVDGMTVDQLKDYCFEHWDEMRDQLLDGSYKPTPVKRVEIPKPGGGVRKLGIPTVRDRMVQQALLQVLQKLWDPTFSDYSYGFRPGRSAHQAVAQAQEYIAEGYRIVVDMDLEKFFDRVNHDILMGRLAGRIADRRVLGLIRAFLNAGVLEKGLVSSTTEGTPQGGPLSPLLSNIVLDDLDRELESRGHRFVRYADDCNIYVRSERAGHRVMESVSRFLSQRLKLKVNEKKSAVGQRWERSFLGFSFTNGPNLKRRIAPKATDRFKERIRELTRRRRGVSIQQVVKDLAGYLNGWLGYFGFCQTPSVLRGLESWVRHRLRSYIWKQWHGGRRYAELRKRGAGVAAAWNVANGSCGPWRAGGSKIMNRVFPNAYFQSLGLPSLMTKESA